MPKPPRLVFVPNARTRPHEAPALTAPEPQLAADVYQHARGGKGPGVRVDAAPQRAFLHAPEGLRQAQRTAPGPSRHRSRRSQSLGEAMPPCIDVALRQQSLKAWRLKGHDGACVCVLELAHNLRTCLQAQAFHTVHIAASGIAGLGGSDLGADTIDCDGASLVVQAQASRPEAHALTSLVTSIRRALQRELARQAPYGGFWVELQATAQTPLVSVLGVGCGPSRPVLLLAVTMPHPSARPYLFLDDAAAVVLDAPAETWLWPHDAASDPFDDVQRGLYRLVKAPHWTDLAPSWRRRVHGSVPATPETDAELWAPLLVHGYQAALLPMGLLVRDVMAQPNVHHAALLLANACASADAAPAGLLPLEVMEMLGGVLHICARRVHEGPHRRLIEDFACRQRRAAMALWVWALAVPTPWVRRAGRLSLESAHTDARGAVQLRARLGPGAFWTPSFDAHGPLEPLPDLAPWPADAPDAIGPARETAWLLGAEALATAVLDTPPAPDAPDVYGPELDAPTEAHEGVHRLAAKRLWQHAARVAADAPADGVRIACAALLVHPSCDIRLVPEACRDPRAVLPHHVWQQLATRLQRHWERAVAAMHTMTPRTAAFDWARLLTLSDARTWMHGTRTAWCASGLRRALALRATGPDGGIVPFDDELHRLLGYALAPRAQAHEPMCIGDVYEWVTIWLRLKRTPSLCPSRTVQLKAALQACGHDGIDFIVGGLVRFAYEDHRPRDAWWTLELLGAPLGSLSDDALTTLLVCAPAEPTVADCNTIKRLQQAHAQRVWHLV